MDFALEDGFTGEEEVLISNYKDVIRNENGIHLRPYEAKVFIVNKICMERGRIMAIRIDQDQKLITLHTKIRLIRWLSVLMDNCSIFIMDHVWVVICGIF